MKCVCVFQATGRATERVEGEYTPPNRHALMIYTLQTAGAEPDPARAQAAAADEGWDDVVILRSKVVVVADLQGERRTFFEQFLREPIDSAHLVVYRQPLA